METKKTWGGARKGAGKKPSGKVHFTIFAKAEDVKLFKKNAAEKGLAHSDILSLLLAGQQLL